MARRRKRGTGGITHRADGLYVAQVSLGLRPDGSRDRRSFSSKSKGDVEFWLRETTRSHARGDEAVNSRLTLGAYLDEWLEYVTPTVRPTTARGYRIHVEKWIAPTIGSEHLIRLVPADVKRVPAAVVKAGRSPRTAQSVLITLRMALQSAVRDGRLERNVAEGIKAPRQAARQINATSPADARAIILAFEGHYLGPLVTVALGTGMRLGELLALRWTDIENGRIRVVGSIRPLPSKDGRGAVLTRIEPKTRRSVRTLEVGRHVAAALDTQRRWQAQHVVSEYVFTTSEGSWFYPGNVNRNFNLRLKAAGLPPMRFHDLRHAYATISLAAGVPLRVIQGALGHTSIALTAAVYAHVLPTLQREAVDLLDDALEIG